MDTDGHGCTRMIKAFKGWLRCPQPVNELEAIFIRGSGCPSVVFLIQLRSLGGNENGQSFLFGDLGKSRNAGLRPGAKRLDFQRAVPEAGAPRFHRRRMMCKRWRIMQTAWSSRCSRRSGKVSSGSRNGVAQASAPAGSGGVSPPSRSHAPGRCFNPQPGRDCATSEAELPGFENGARRCAQRPPAESGKQKAETATRQPWQARVRLGHVIVTTQSPPPPP
jgi:hypothetical protein